MWIIFAKCGTFLVIGRPLEKGDCVVKVDFHIFKVVVVIFVRLFCFWYIIFVVTCVF